MFFRRVQPAALDEQGMYMPPQTTFSGELRTNANIRVSGAIQGGMIETTGNVIVTETARVDGTVRAKGVSIQGVFRGVLRAEQVQILAGSQVDGKLYVNTYYTEKGATMRAEILSVEDSAAQRAFEDKATQLGFSFVGDRKIPVEVMNEMA